MDAVRLQLKDKGFSKNQIQEIEEGLKAGLPVEVYAQKEFLAIQMRQIRLGLQSGLPVEWYANLKYDWFQMEEIRKGLESGANVSIYASPEISYDRMQQIRLGLEAGMDLSAYRQLEAGVLKQLRLALLRQINIVPFLVEGYDTEQLEAIREALEKNINVGPWVRKEYRGVALHEIFLGLENHCDVTLYAKPQYNWQQMREIRLGLENRVDVSQYLSVYYSYRQMQEIRLGLEQGLDVSYYKSPMYTALQMHERRILLESSPEKLIVTPMEEELTRYEEGPFRVALSEDEMEAYLTFEQEADSLEITQTQVMKSLWEKGICFGTNEEVIAEALKKKEIGRCYRVAMGKKRIDGKDGWYELFFRTDLSGLPKQLESGKIDYRDVDWFETVNKGQTLASYHKAEPGVDGMTVTGKKIPAKNGREKGHLLGKGFLRTDKDEYISELQGIVTFYENHLNISEVLVMQDVNLTTGDVDFEGSVLIHGNVFTGATVKAGKDVIVEGYVEDAKILCGGTAYLKNGMNGTGGGTVEAKEGVVGYFFERAHITSQGTIQGDYFFQCDLKTNGEVLAVGKKGTIAGGRVYAGNGVRVRCLGNPAGLNTTVMLGCKNQMMEEETDIKTQLKETKKEFEILDNARKEFQKKYPPEVRSAMPIYLKIESAVYTKEKQLEQLQEEKARLEEQKKQAAGTTVTVENQIYEGVTVEIDGAKWRSKELKAVKIGKKDKSIVVFSI